MNFPSKSAWRNRMNELEVRRQLAWVHGPDSHKPGTVLKYSDRSYQRQHDGSLVRVYIEPQAQLDAGLADRNVGATRPQL